MMGKRLKEIFGLILINITLVSGSLNAETVYADTQAKIEIEKTEMPLKICVDEENKKTVLQIVAAWKKIYKNNGVELMVIPSGQKASEEKVQEIQNEITMGEGPDVFLAEGPNPTWSEQRAVVFEDPQKEMYQGTFLSLKPYMKYFDIDILEERILSAGMANEEQILLPMTYDYFLYAFTTQDLPENTEISRNWLELARQKEKAIQQIVGQRSGVQFFDTFSEVVDYKKKTLLYSEEQIKKVLDETAALKTRSLALNWKIKDTGVVSLNDLEELGGEKTVHTVFAMPNQEGGFTANVTLYAGINIDTDGFNSKSGPRTFEAAAFLRRHGADVTRVRKMLRSNMNEYKEIAKAVSRVEVYKDAFAISIFNGDGIDTPTVGGAKTANDLLDISGIKASFVITPYEDKIYVSARSIDEVNVQLVMEKLGGGGHISIAGAQFTDCTIDQAINKIKDGEI